MTITGYNLKYKGKIAILQMWHRKGEDKLMAVVTKTANSDESVMMIVLCLISIHSTLCFS